MLTVEPPAQAYTKLQTVGRPATASAVCAWCEEPYDTADVIPWRDIDGHYEGAKMFHEVCWADALRSLRARFHVAQQLGLTPKEIG